MRLHPGIASIDAKLTQQFIVTRRADIYGRYHLDLLSQYVVAILDPQGFRKGGLILIYGYVTSNKT